MTACTVNAVRAVIGPVPKIIGRPSFASLWDLKKHLVSGLKKLKNVDHPNYGHSGYLVSSKESTEISTVLYEDAKDIEAYKKISHMVITDNDQRNYCEILHTAITKNNQQNFQNMVTALTSILKEVIECRYQCQWCGVGSAKKDLALRHLPVSYLTSI